jgi:hypothetical protein
MASQSPHGADNRNSSLSVYQSFCCAGSLLNFVFVATLLSFIAYIYQISTATMFGTSEIGSANSDPEATPHLSSSSCNLALSKSKSSKHWLQNHSFVLDIVPNLLAGLSPHNRCLGPVLLEYLFLFPFLRRTRLL